MRGSYGGMQITMYVFASNFKEIKLYNILYVHM